MSHSGDTDHDCHANEKSADREHEMHRGIRAHVGGCFGNVLGDVSEIDFHEQTRQQPDRGDKIR